MPGMTSLLRRPRRETSRFQALPTGLILPKRVVDSITLGPEKTGREQWSHYASVLGRALVAAASPVAVEPTNQPSGGGRWRG